MIRVLLADDQALVRAGFAALLDAQDGIEVVGQAADGAVADRAKPPPPPDSLDALTERERQLVGLVGEGLSNDDIAGRLVLSPATVKTHVNRAMMKLGARDRAHLVVFAYEAGLIRPGWAS